MTRVEEAAPLAQLRVCVGRILRAAGEASSVSQIKLTKALRMDHIHLCGIERGQVSASFPALLLTIAALGIALDELAGTPNVQKILNKLDPSLQ